MRGFRQLAWADAKLYLREPIATFFTIAFAPLLVVLFGAIYGNGPAALFGGRGAMDVSVPAYIALILCTVGFLSIPINLSAARESGVLRRFRATPLRPFTYILADVVTNLAMMLIGVVCLVLTGWLLYRVRFQGSVASMVVAIVFCGLALSSMGYVIGGLAPNPRAAQVIGMVIFYPMLFLSGAAIPSEVMPESVRRIAAFLPLTYAVRLLRGLWVGEPWRDHWAAVAVLGGVLVVCTVVAARLFRWE